MAEYYLAINEGCRGSHARGDEVDELGLILLPLYFTAELSQPMRICLQCSQWLGMAANKGHRVRKPWVKSHRVDHKLFFHQTLCTMIDGSSWNGLFKVSAKPQLNKLVLYILQSCVCIHVHINKVRFENWRDSHFYIIQADLRTIASDLHKPDRERKKVLVENQTDVGNYSTDNHYFLKFYLLITCHGLDMFLSLNWFDNSCSSPWHFHKIFGPCFLTCSVQATRATGHLQLHYVTLHWHL